MRQSSNVFSMTALSNAAAWISTGVAVIYGIKKTGSAKCLWGFAFPMLVHSGVKLTSHNDCKEEESE